MIRKLYFFNFGELIRMKKVALLMVLVALVFAVMPAAAQTAEPIAYGAVVSGELVDNGSALYTFTGTAGDVVVVRFGDFEYEGTLNGATVEIKDAAGVSLAKYEGFSTAETYAAIPADGEYTLTVSTTDLGGIFTLEFIQATILENGAAITGSMTNEEVNYYAVVTDAPFTLKYELTAGDFRPQVTVKKQGDFGLEDVAAIYGSEVTSGSMTVTPVAQTAYLVSLDEALFDFNFDTVTADYSLTFAQ